MKKEDAGFKLDEEALEPWGDTLSDHNHPQEAIAILALNVSQYPDSGDAFVHLAGAYTKAGQKQQAIDNCPCR